MEENENNEFTIDLDSNKKPLDLDLILTEEDLDSIEDLFN